VTVESVNGIWSLDYTLPGSTDDLIEGDDHIRVIKQSLRLTFPNLSSTAAVTASELSYLTGLTTNVNDHLDTLSSSLATVISVAADLSASLSTVMGYGSLYLKGSTTEFSSTTSLSLFTGWDIPGPNKLTTISTTSGVIAVSVTGIYGVDATFSVSASTASTLTVAIYVDAAASNAQSSTRIQANGRRAVTVVGHVSASAGEEIGIRMMTAVTSSITVKDAQLTVKRIG